VLSVNHAPLGSVSICGRRDLVLPKPLWCESQGRPLTFAEVVAAGLANAYLSAEYAAAGLQVIDNDPDDIRAAVAELDDRLHACFDDTQRDLELARQFERVYESSDHLGPLRTRIAATFLRRHADLLSPAGPTVRAA
jgi:putative glycosyltransferase (TIGR04372 family)